MNKKINPYSNNLIVKQITQLQKLSKLSFYYSIDDTFLNRYFFDFLALEITKKKSLTEEDVIIFEIFDDLKSELISNTDFFNEDSDLLNEISSLEKKIFLLYFNNISSISNTESLDLLYQLGLSACDVFIMLPKNFETKNIVDNTSNESLIDAFVQFNNFVPSPSIEGKMNYLEKHLEQLNLSIEPKAKELFLKQIQNPEIRFSHTMNYVISLRNHELIKEKKIRAISDDTIPILGTIENSFESIGENFLKELNTHFSNTEILNFFRFFIKKTPSESIESSPGTKEDFVKRFKGIKESAFFLEVANSERYPVLFRDQKDFWEGQENYFINGHFLKYWNWLQNVKRIERYEANLYLKYVDLAKKFSQSNGNLLNEEQVAESTVLLESENFTAGWAKYYSEEYELTKNYLIDSKNHLLKTRDSQERKRKLRMRRARNTILFVGGAFLLSMIFLLIAYGAYNNAISAQEAEIQAKLVAEENAKLASLNATKAKENAAKAEENAVFAKDQEEIAKQRAIMAMEAENLAQKNAKLAQQKELEARMNEKEAQRLTVVANNNAQEATRQKEFAERKTLQQIARSDAIRSIQMYENGDLSGGFSLAKEAFSSNKDNNGNIYEKEIIFSLLKGYSSLYQKNYTSQEQIKKIAFLDDQNTIVCQQLDNKIAFLDRQTFEVIATVDMPNLRTFYVIDESKIILSFFNTLPQIFDVKLMQKENQINLNQTLVDVFPIQKNETLLLLKNSLYSFNLSSNELSQIDFNEPLHHLIKHQDAFLGISGKYNLKNIKWNRANNAMETSLLKIFDSEITSLSEVFENDKIAIGLKNGNVIILNLETNETLFNNQIHKSKISSCAVTTLNEKSILTTTGFDGAINIFYGKGNEWKNSNYSSIPNISSHKDWITSSLIDNETKTLITASYDRTIKLWPLNPLEIINYN